MWTTFILGIIIATALLFIPGYMQLRCTGLMRSFALCCAPFVSLVEYVLLGLAFGLFGMSVGWASIVLPVVAVSVLAAIIKALFAHGRVSVPRGRAEKTPLPKALHLVLYVLFGSLVTGYLFVLPLTGPDSFVQEFDNAYHLNAITAFVESGRFSFLQATTFPTVPLVPFGDISYYPAAWHILCALICDLLSVSAPFAENVVNVVFLAFVYPLGMCAFLTKIFERNPKVVLYGAVCVPAFAAFPWGFMVTGPLYSNMAAFALLPAIMYCFMVLFDDQARSSRLVKLVILLLGVFCLVATQPNAIFTAAVILTPFCMIKTVRCFKEKGEERKGVLFALTFLLLVVGIWVGCRYIPMLASIVNYNWQPYASISQAGFDYLDLGYRNATTQILLAIMVVIGIVFALVKKRFRWLVTSYIFFGLAFFSVAAPQIIHIGSLLSGFWYNDVDRIAASAVLVMVPLATLGLWASIQAVGRLLDFVWNEVDQRVLRTILVLVFCGVVFAPNFILAGRGDVATSLGDRYDRLRDLATTARSLDEEEMDFLEEVDKVIADEANQGQDGRSSKLVNFPFDGSVYAYTANGIETLYKHYFPGSSANSRLIQEHLAEYARNEEVQQAVDNLDLGYVLVLDSNDSAEPTVYQSFLKPEDWKGITEINDETPGFEIMLSDGDMRLYKIVPQ